MGSPGYLYMRGEVKDGVDGVDEGFTFHGGLGELYRETLERERLTVWGCSSKLRLYLVAPGGYELSLELSEGWTAWRHSSVEPDVENWRLEIEEHPDLPYDVMKRIAAVDLVGHDLAIRCKVAQVTKPTLAGHVWHLRLYPTGEAIP